MNCPNCAVPMEREDHVEPTVGPGASGIVECPHAIYACEECQGEWIWRRGRRLEPLFDPRAENVPGLMGVES